jgi:hypothetical protein
MFWVLKTGVKGLGLITKVGILPVPLQRGITRRNPPAFYANVPNMIEDQAWRDPKLAWQVRFSPDEETRIMYARRWARIQQLPRLELSPIDDEDVRVFVASNRL